PLSSPPRSVPYTRTSRSYGEASDLGREWLAVTPYDAAAHSALSVALAETGDLTSAAQHFGYVMMLRPEAEQAHAQLRQILLSLADRKSTRLNFQSPDILV